MATRGNMLQPVKPRARSMQTILWKKMVTVNQPAQQAFSVELQRESQSGSKKNGRGRGRGEEETLARKPHDSGKRPLIFHGMVHLKIDSSSGQITNILPDLKNLLCSLKHAPGDCKTVIKRSFTIKEVLNSKQLLRNFLFFIVKLNFE